MSARLALLHVHQRSSALEAREAFALAVESVPSSYDRIALTTCHRVELYAALPFDSDPKAHFAATLEAPIDAATLLLDGDVAHHLFRVACGLDSAVRGEGQILGQTRRTFDAARARGRVHPLLADLFQHALRLGRDVRATTALGSVRRTIGSAAVDEAMRHFEQPTSIAALVVGAGEIGKLAARALRRRVAHLIVANRDRARAERVAAEADAEVAPLEALDDALARADLVISAADTRGALLTADRLRARLARGPLVLVDMAVPRSVDAEGRALPGLVYRSVDDLADETDPALVEALARVEERCAGEAAAFLARQRERAAVPTIRSLRDRAERVRRAQLERALAKLSHLGARDRRVVETLSASLTNALLHDATVALRRAPDRAKEAATLLGLGKGER